MPVRGDADVQWTREEADRLTAHSNMLGGTIRAIELAAKDPEFNRTRHKLYSCRWWKAGVGQVASEGEWAVSPAQVLVDHNAR